MSWDPDAYPATIRSEIHDYEELQDEVARAARGTRARSILDLGTGTGETASRVLRIHTDAHLVGIDSSAEMLGAARRALPRERVSLIQQELSAPLPDHRFDLVISALAIHHLEGDAKAALFAKIAQRLNPGGTFLMGDVVVPDDPADALIEIEEDYDFPSTIDEQLRWLEEATFSTKVVWRRKDLAVFKGELA